MQYILLLYSEEAGWGRLSAAEREDWLQHYGAFAQAMVAEGVLIDGNHMQSARLAKTVTTVGGEAEVREGSFNPGPEVLSGYFILDVADAEAALAWAIRCPGAAHGHVEVRPLGVPPKN